MKWDNYFNTITATVTGNKDGIYIKPSNNETHIDPRKATNYKSIDMTGVNHACINRAEDGTFYIFQISGYTPEKGLFCELI